MLNGWCKHSRIFDILMSILNCSLNRNQCWILYFKLYRDAVLDIWLFSPRIPSNGHNQKVHMHMVDLMSSIICEGDTVSQELLDTVLVNLVPAHKVRAQSQKSSLQSHIAPLNVDASRNCSVTVWSKLIISVDWGIEFSIPCNSVRPLQVRTGKAA